MSIGIKCMICKADMPWPDDGHLRRLCSEECRLERSRRIKDGLTSAERQRRKGISKETMERWRKKNQDRVLLYRKIRDCKRRISVAERKLKGDALRAVTEKEEAEIAAIRHKLRTTPTARSKALARGK